MGVGTGKATKLSLFVSRNRVYLRTLKIPAKGFRIFFHREKTLKLFTWKLSEAYAHLLLHLLIKKLPYSNEAGLSTRLQSRVLWAKTTLARKLVIYSFASDTQYSSMCVFPWQIFFRSRRQLEKFTSQIFQLSSNF